MRLFYERVKGNYEMHIIRACRIRIGFEEAKIVVVREMSSQDSALKISSFKEK